MTINFRTGCVRKHSVVKSCLFVCLFDLRRWSKRLRSPPQETTSVCCSSARNIIDYFDDHVTDCVFVVSLIEFPQNNLVSHLSAYFLNWSGVSEHLTCHLFFFFYFSFFPLTALSFLLLFRGSCQCLISVTGQCCRAQVAPRACVLLYLTR